MKKKLITIILLGLLTFSVSLAHHWHPDYDRSSESFVYDANLADYQILGTIDTEPNEGWHCQLYFTGDARRQIIIRADANAPSGLWIDPNDFDIPTPSALPIAHYFGWRPQVVDVGLHYVNFGLFVVGDPNAKDRGSVVIKVNPPLQFEPIGGCTKN